MRSVADVIYQYWGKALTSDHAQAVCHLLPFHCLDVASVASAWWDESAMIRRLLAGDGPDQHVVRAWVLFFVALHDLGKFDIRFQLKSLEALLFLRPDFDSESVEPEKYFHGPAGCTWLVRSASFLDEERYDHWQPWMEAVAGHHGDLSGDTFVSNPEADEDVIELDRVARIEWLDSLAELFLEPLGLSLDDDPPPCPQALAGFCAVADWVGSNSEWFPYQDQPLPLDVYWSIAQRRGQEALGKTGILGISAREGGMAAVFPRRVPRQIQNLVGDLPAEHGLVLVEAPTGSGKTEFALAYAARLLAAGVAESIIFALPTQATANAMLERLEEAAPRLFQGDGNLVLAHGRARFHKGYASLKEAGRRRTAQGREDAIVQCAQWLAQSRKRVFLGQIGVCTIDQVLVSVLAVRHQFVRAFGLRRSVLIVDEVHAYDAYMYGLLTKVLAGQAKAGGSAVLMSATLPAHQRDLLLDAWGVEQAETQPSTYPLVTWGTQGASPGYWNLDKHPGEQPPPRAVDVELWGRDHLRPREEDLVRVVKAAESGARVAIVCNLVAEAQALWRQLSTITSVPVDLFHARFVFADRERIEQQILRLYGPEGPSQGRILVATQVVEQSLDLDFDWLITQLCPVDLLFQRMGRLHRHQRERVEGFDSPLCTVLVPPNSEGYGLHEKVYDHRRILWRTHQMLVGTDRIQFPSAYREWIEPIYSEAPWSHEPDNVRLNWEAFHQSAQGRYFGARQLAEADMVPLQDTEANAARMTRDGDNSFQVILTQSTEEGEAYLDGRVLASLEEFDRWEAEDLNSVNVPSGWKKLLGEADELGRYRLKLVRKGRGWFGDHVSYHRDSGLEKNDESA